LPSWEKTSAPTKTFTPLESVRARRPRASRLPRSVARNPERPRLRAAGRASPKARPTSWSGLGGCPDPPRAPLMGEAPLLFPEQAYLHVGEPVVALVPQGRHVV
jgi:hypothetical protein